MNGRWFYYNLPVELNRERQKIHELIQFEATGLYRLESNEPASKILSLSSGKRFCVPLFLYTLKGSKSTGTIDYPTVPSYVRNLNQITIRPREIPFQDEPALLCGSLTIPLKTSARSEVNLPVDELDTLLSERVMIRQGTFCWTVEGGAKTPADEETFVKVTEQVGYPSLKSFLDPDGGFERLLNDVMTRVFPQSQKMQKILDILRSASEEEESAILTSTYQHDPALYTELTQGIFTEQLLPYLSLREVSELIIHAPEILLIQAIQDKSKSKYYRRFLSKNRANDLHHASLPSDPRPKTERETAESLWAWIFSHLRQRRSSFITIETDEVLRHARCEPSALPQTFTADYISGGSTGIFAKTGEHELHLQLEFPVSTMEIYFETLKYKFRKIELRYVAPGLLKIKVERFPRMILIGGFTVEGTFFETLVLKSS